MDRISFGDETLRKARTYKDFIDSYQLSNNSGD